LQQNGPLHWLWKQRHHESRQHPACCGFALARDSVAAVRLSRPTRSCHSGGEIFPPAWGDKLLKAALAVGSLSSLRDRLVRGWPVLPLEAQAAFLQDSAVPLLLGLFLSSCLATLSALAAKLSKRRRKLQEDLRNAERLLSLQEKRFLALVDNATCGTILLTPQAEIHYASPAAHELYTFGKPLVGRSVLNLIHAEDRDRMTQALNTLTGRFRSSVAVDLRFRRADGSWRWTELTSTNLLEEPAVGAIVTTCRDIELQKQSEERLKQMAVTDGLTGLANYRRLMDVLRSETRRFDRTARSFAILMFDLDGLKRINDAHGHIAGSRAICRLADVLRTSCRSIDTPARFGGDEFVVVLPESNLEAAQGVANRVVTRLRAEKESPPLSVSFGIAICPDDGETAAALLQKADIDLYEMKASSNNLQSVC
jgi:diguanylate cyclase (GGDEF)-like protein/PAS domain S-box-containing protein